MLARRGGGKKGYREAAGDAGCNLLPRCDVLTGVHVTWYTLSTSSLGQLHQKWKKSLEAIHIFKEHIHENTLNRTGRSLFTGTV